VQDGKKEAKDAPQVISGEFDRLLNGVYVFSGHRAIAAGESGAIIETVDGGKTWKLIPSGEWAPLFKVDFVTSEVGYVVGAQGAVLRTADSGKTWKRVETGTTDHVFRFVVRDGQMMAVGHRGVVLVGDPESGALERQGLGVYGWISGIGLGPEKSGVMVGGQGLFLRTEDGGKTWQPVVDTH
jgi:photosystem II stability/assembly factor-like uncharacterized protein